MIGTIAIVLATIVAGVFVERRFGPKRLAGGRAQLPAPGTTPDHPIDDHPVQRCCRAEMELDTDRIRYGDRELTVLRYRCATCGDTRRLYSTRS